MEVNAGRSDERYLKPDDGPGVFQERKVRGTRPDASLWRGFFRTGSKCSVAVYFDARKFSAGPKRERLLPASAGMPEDAGRETAGGLAGFCG